MMKRVAYAFGIISLISAGSYLFVYLYRWEWNRALIAGVIFIAAEIALAAAAILERIKSVERTLFEQHQERERERVLDHLQQSAPPPSKPFAWLKDNDRMNVFVPFLMGAGLVASGIAWLVEHFARATAKPKLERGLATRMSVLALPEGGLLPAGDFGATTFPVGPVIKPGRATLRKQLLALGLSILAGTVGVDALSDATQTRPDTFVAQTRSTIVIDMVDHGYSGSMGIAATSLWGVCQATVPNDITGDGIQKIGSARYLLEVSPALGKNGERRLRGCLEDATLDNLSASVVSISS